MLYWLLRRSTQETERRRDFAGLRAALVYLLLHLNATRMPRNEMSRDWSGGEGRRVKEGSGLWKWDGTLQWRI